MKKRVCLQGCIYAEKRNIAFSPVWLQSWKPTPQYKLPTAECMHTKCETCYMKENMKHYVASDKDDCEIWEVIQNGLNKDVSIFCNFTQKGVRKYLTTCEHFQNARLFEVIQRIPEYLPTIPFEELRTCKSCKGKGFVIVKNPEIRYKLDGTRKDMYEREDCVICEKRGYIRQIPNKNLNDCVKS